MSPAAARAGTGLGAGIIFENSLPVANYQGWPPFCFYLKQLTALPVGRVWGSPAQLRGIQSTAHCAVHTVLPTLHCVHTSTVSTAHCPHTCAAHTCAIHACSVYTWTVHACSVHTGTAHTCTLQGVAGAGGACTWALLEGTCNSFEDVKVTPVNPFTYNFWYFLY